MRTATSVARLEMITTNRKISRCNVVIDDEAAEDSFAMRPLEMAYKYTRGHLGWKNDGKGQQDGCLTADARRPLKSNLLCLVEYQQGGRRAKSVGEHVRVPRGCCHLLFPSVLR